VRASRPGPSARRGRQHATSGSPPSARGPSSPAGPAPGSRYVTRSPPGRRLRPPADRVVPSGTAAVLADLRPDRLPAAADPLAVSAGLRPLFAAPGARGAAVLVVEGMQWAGPPSASVLLFACRRLATDRLLALLSCTAAPAKSLPAARASFIDGDRRASAIWLGGLADLTAQEPPARDAHPRCQRWLAGQDRAT
jgi:hypothetical protein